MLTKAFDNCCWNNNFLWYISLSIKLSYSEYYWYSRGAECGRCDPRATLSTYDFFEPSDIEVYENDYFFISLDAIKSPQPYLG